ncbi:uncharacterized protein LOC124083101 isoform X9 [Marmota monax]|nr:uncharacterized protein LOC124083101 isoform X9 [Marmota monax]XP_058430298.1 uncharacterized protein LOC124083101 isoform X9 [Marmota monax]
MVKWVPGAGRQTLALLAHSPLDAPERPLGPPLAIFQQTPLPLGPVGRWLEWAGGCGRGPRRLFPGASRRKSSLPGRWALAASRGPRKGRLRSQGLGGQSRGWSLPSPGPQSPGCDPVTDAARTPLETLLQPWTPCAPVPTWIHSQGLPGSSCSPELLLSQRPQTSLHVTAPKDVTLYELPMAAVTNITYWGPKKRKELSANQVAATPRWLLHPKLMVSGSGRSQCSHHQGSRQSTVLLGEEDPFSLASRYAVPRGEGGPSTADVLVSFLQSFRAQSLQTEVSPGTPTEPSSVASDKSLPLSLINRVKPLAGCPRLGFSQRKQGCTGAGEPAEDLTSHHLSSFPILCVILTAPNSTLVRAATSPRDPLLSRPSTPRQGKPALFQTWSLRSE